MIYALFFGDSITYGEYDGVFGGWVDILKRYALQKFHEGSNEVIIYNLGIGGETTEGLIKRMPHELNARNSPEGNMVFIAYGANDLAIKDGDYMVAAEQFRINIEMAVQIAKERTNDIYIVSILPFSKTVDGVVVVASGKLRTNEVVLVYNKILQDIAAEYALTYIDFYTAFVEDKEILLSQDGVHPNEKGYGMMAELAIPIIEKYL